MQWTKDSRRAAALLAFTARSPNELQRSTSLRVVAPLHDGSPPDAASGHTDRLRPESQSQRSTCVTDMLATATRADCRFLDYKKCVNCSALPTKAHSVARCQKGHEFAAIRARNVLEIVLVRRSFRMPLDTATTIVASIPKLALRS